MNSIYDCGNRKIPGTSVGLITENSRQVQTVGDANTNRIFWPVKPDALTRILARAQRSPSAMTRNGHWQ
jgi:hypothetical protein